AVAGTHGKTTTTSMLASVMTHGGFEPTFVIGGRVKSFSSNALLGKGQYILAEADESDGSFLYLNPVISVITNIDKDHLANYGGDPARLEQAFLEFAHHLPFYGLLVTCLDDPVIRKLLPEFNRPVLTYGLDVEADIHATDLDQHGMVSRFKVCTGEEQFPVEIRCGGEHNVRNALATIAVARELGMPMVDILSSLSDFSGIQRRFDVVGSYVVDDDINDILVIDDYAHHPREIESILKAVRSGWPERRIVTVFQPHRYSRTRDLFEDFVQVLSGTDVLLLTEVYAAGEQPISGVDGKTLSGAIRHRGRVDPVYIENIEDILDEMPVLLKEHDVVLLIGAGNISMLADRIRKEWRLAG
ncbi:MAG: UDP-N-acetylmuramate--L-alanine ligase, partial [Gammaproteobacteria bacterium]